MLAVRPVSDVGGVYIESTWTVQNTNVCLVCTASSVAEDNTKLIVYTASV